MKNCILTLFLAFMGLQAIAQVTCSPDRNIPDTSRGVFPLPFDPVAFPTGGIKDTACLNADYRFTLTIKTPGSVAFAGTTLNINAIEIATTGAVANLPEGLTYACNPPNCKFPKDSTGCVIIYGKPTNAANIGANDLVISGLIRSVFAIPVSFPNASIAPGKYILHLKPAGSANCFMVSTRRTASDAGALEVWPNPTNGYAMLNMEIEQAGQYQIQILDLLGKTVQNHTTNLRQGNNRFELSVANLPPAMYQVVVRNGERSSTLKLFKTQ